MRRITEDSIWLALAGAAVLLVCKVTLSVVSGYGRYFPPDFDADFLLGREAYFFGPYRWAFYTHLVAGPIVRPRDFLPQLRR